jgi:monoterpene epsilon-lactone hydrolase
MASPQLKLVIEQAKAMASQLGGPPQETRVAFDQMGMQQQLASGTKIEAVVAGGVKADWFTTPESENDRVILYLHGGGYIFGSPTSHRGMISRLAKAARARVLALDYRLAPEHPFPAAVEDSTAAYRWLLEQGYKPSKIALAGDSAGGGLTIATLVALREAKTPLPAAAVPISPWVDLEGTGESMKTRAAVDPMVQKEGIAGIAAQYLGQTDPKNPLAAPLYADLKGLPPLLIHVGDAETLLSDATRIAEKAKQAGVKVDLKIYPEMIHVWHLFADILPEAQQAIEEIGGFVRLRTA